MYWLIENSNQLENLYLEGYEKVFIEIIPYNPVDHPTQNQVCAFYIKPLTSTKGFILPVSHSETLPLDISDIERVLMEFKDIYVRDKKEFLHYFVHTNIFDITLHPPIYIPEYTQAHTFLYSKYPNKKDVNKIVPIVKHYEYCEKIFEDLKHKINEPINPFYNNKATMVFNAIERSGLRIDREQFEKSFHVPTSDFVYTQYNFKTLTTRPSNKFGGINYAAINKENEDRRSFIARNSKLVELDISSFHPNILGKLVGYNFGNADIHASFAEMYGVDYKKAKEITFKQLYGGIFKQYKHLEFFQKVQKYVDELWEKFQNDGFIECPISNYRFYQNKLDDMNPQKLLNYLLQNLETSINVLILWDVIKILKGKKSKIILTVYDSLLIDFDKNEEYILNDIYKIFDKYGLKIKCKKGINYHDLISI